MLTNFRKEEISELAEAISENYFQNRPVEPEIVASDNGLTFSYGKYKNAFDGLLQHRSGRFHIFINLDRLTSATAPRARFTFGHELGHYFIDEHRNALKKGKTPPHPSFNKLVAKNIAEQEADFFSSCFLMPSKSFKAKCLKNPLDPKLIDNLASFFQTSISSVIFRYLELSMFPMILIFCKDGKVEWNMSTTDFIYKWPTKKGSPVPKTSIAGEYFYQRKKTQDKDIIYPYDWFKDFEMDKNQQLYEKCYYLSKSSVLSMIWVKEK
jgi:Zn-dependent peptidase ImmA (M78 family)